MSDDTSYVIEVRDPALDGQGIARLVQQRAAERRAESAELVDWAALVPEPLQPDNAALGGDATPADFPGLRESLAELIGRGYLHEPDFRSETPVVGPIIVAVRRLWNWMSTKWYVRPILWQQSEVNARTARTISDLAQWHELDSRRLGQLEARVAELEARLAHQEAKAES
jgi:hypothetical protein